MEAGAWGMGDREGGKVQERGEKPVFHRILWL